MSAKEVPQNCPSSHNATSDEKIHAQSSVAQQILAITGPWGRWQLHFFLLFFYLQIFACWHSLQLAFIAPNLDFWCAEVDGKDPQVLDKLLRQQPNQCNTDHLWHQNGNGSQICSRWTYNLASTASGGNGNASAFYRSTIVSEWDLVCGRKWMAGFAHSVYMAGWLAAGLVMTHASDRFGRRVTMVAGWAISLGATVGAALAGNLLLFYAFRFLISFGLVGAYATGFVLLLEITGPQYREAIGLASNYGWTLGYTTLPLIVWAGPGRDFRQLLYCCAAVQLLAAVPAYWLITESPRWLLAQSGRGKEAAAVLRRAVKANKKSSTDKNENNEDAEMKIARLLKSASNILER